MAPDTAPNGDQDRITDSAATRGVRVDYCPRCGAWNGAPCTTPGGRVVPDHAIRVPQCNGRGDTCNAHGGRCD